MQSIKKEFKNVEYVIVMMIENFPQLQGTIKKGESNKEELEEIKKELKEKNIKSLTIIKTKEYIKKLITYTKNATVYEMDKGNWEDIIETHEYTAETYLIGNRFEVMVQKPEDYPYKDCELCVHDTLKEKYYISDKLRFNPKKWNFDFDNDNLKAPEMPYY